MTNTYSSFVIAITFMVAFILTLLPMPEWTVWLRPAWVLLVLIYWASSLTHRVSVGAAWLAGLSLDVLNGTLLGEHALALALVTFLVVRIHAQFRMFPLLQQSLFVCLFVLFYQFILFCIQGFIGEPPKTWLYWLSPITSMLLWPWVFMIMRDCRRRFRII